MFRNMYLWEYESSSLKEELSLSKCESSSVGRARPCQGRGREFESRLSLQKPFLFQEGLCCFYYFNVMLWININSECINILLHLSVYLITAYARTFRLQTNCMSQYNQEKRRNYIKKLVSNAKAMVTQQINIPLGSQKMTKIIYWINNIEPLNDIDLSIFSRFYSEIQHLAFGIERSSYNKELLQSEDSKLDYIVLNHQEKIIEKCYEIIHRYDIDKA
jgi:hypothetical protein